MKKNRLIYYSTLLLFLLGISYSCLKESRNLGNLTEPGIKSNDIDLIKKAKIWNAENRAYVNKNGESDLKLHTLVFDWDKFAIDTNLSGQQVLTVPISSTINTEAKYLELGFILDQEGNGNGMIKEYMGNPYIGEMTLNLYTGVGKKFESGWYRADTKELTVKNISRYQSNLNSKKMAGSGSMGGTLEEVVITREAPKPPAPNIYIPPTPPTIPNPPSIPVYPSMSGGGGTASSTSAVKKLNKNDPCANKNELNNRKKNPKILAKNNEIKNLTLKDGPQKGLEHGYNTYINLNNGNITRFTNVEVGSLTGGGSQEVPSYEAWNWLPNNQVEVTADYSHTHPFKSGPSAMDVFSGIFPYMATSTGSITALSPAQKQVYLSYHSINVMTTNHDYAITITDPAKWVSRYPNMETDQDKFRDLFRKYEKSGYNGHTAQELALLDLYGDMIQLYRSDVGQANFEPVIYKIDSKTLKKIISNINC